MKLIIDRSSTERGIYSVDFGPDFDILVGSWKIVMKFISPSTMSDIDYLFTNSTSKIFCITHIKHPLLMKSYNKPEQKSNQHNASFWSKANEEIWCRPLREYFALRLIHRRYDIDLYELGKRLFVD